MKNFWDLKLPQVLGGEKKMVLEKPLCNQAWGHMAQRHRGKKMRKPTSATGGAP